MDNADLDYYAFTLNCLFIPLGKLLKNGFNTGHGSLRPPQGIQSAASLAAIALQANQNEMFGGQAFPTFDWDLAPYVAKTFIKELAREIQITTECPKREINSFKETLQGFYDADGTLIENKDKILRAMKSMFLLENPEKIYKDALDSTYNLTFQAMEAFCHNMNSLQSRAGNQTPFSSINYGTCTTPEGRMIIRTVLETTMNGLGHSETQIFPIQIFKCLSGVSYDVGDPNYDLFQLALQCSAMRLFPNFSNLNVEYNHQYYKKGRPETEVAVMGCRTRTLGNTFDKEHEQVTGRGNFSFSTINLPRIALEVKNVPAEKRIGAFFKRFDEMIDLCITSLEDRFELIGKKHLYNFPFLMGEGLYVSSENFQNDDTIAEIIKQSTLSVGFCGLAEALVCLIGKHHGESPEAQELGLRIVGHLRERMDDKAKATGLSWSCFASPAESTAGTFVKKDRKYYGVVPGVTDRDYYTNSSHVPVYYNTTFAHKIDTEAPYHALCNAGHIGYVEFDGDPMKNLTAYEAVVRYAIDHGMTYFSINTQNDRCPICNYLGPIGDECPRCGFKEGVGVSIERLEKCGCINTVKRNYQIV